MRRRSRREDTGEETVGPTVCTSSGKHLTYQDSATRWWSGGGGWASRHGRLRFRPMGVGATLDAGWLAPESAGRPSVVVAEVAGRAYLVAAAARTAFASVMAFGGVSVRTSAQPDG